MREKLVPDVRNIVSFDDLKAFGRTFTGNGSSTFDASGTIQFNNIRVINLKYSLKAGHLSITNHYIGESFLRQKSRFNDANNTSG